MSDSSSGKFEFSCPSCLRPIKAGLKAAGKTLPCPGCGKMITVPTPEEARWDAVHEPPSEDEYAIAEPIESPRYTSPIVPGWEENHFESELDRDTYRDPPRSDRPVGPGIEDDEEFVIVERPKLPPHPMVTGIFSIFVDPAAIFWYLFLTVAIAVVIGILTVPMLIFSGVIQSLNIENAGQFVIGAVNTGFGSFLGLVVLFFASNVFLSILQDSSVGNRTVESWPNKTGGSFSMVGILFVLGALAYSIVIGLAIMWASGTQAWLLIQLAVCFFTFPFFLVSSLETDSPMMPISSSMVRSLGARFTTWLVFYVETAILYGIAIGTTILLTWKIGAQPQSLSIACAVVLGPLCTFFLFIYFRLLGRLAWVCDEWLRSLEPEEEEEEEEGEDHEWEEGNER